MPGRGPAPKDPKTRKRKNRPPEVRELPTPEEAARNKVPALHKRDDKIPWHDRVKEWWESIWKSPMASQWIDSDIKGGLRHLANLHQIVWTATSNSMMLAAMAEIRLQEVRFGLSPMDRTRLRWEVGKADEAEAKANKRKDPPAAVPENRDDPRVGLKLA